MKTENKEYKGLSGKFKSYYDALLDFATILRNSDGKKRSKIIIDLLFLIFITCILKIPFIFVRNLGDNLIEIISAANITVLAIWGLIIEFIYVIVALSFFIKTLRKWISSIS